MAAPIVELRQVDVTYPGEPGVHAVVACDLCVGTGDHVALMGRSGSGKTTLLNVVGLLVRPTSGSYALTGIETTELSERDRARLRAESIGFVFQAFWLLPHRTVLDNVATGLLYRSTPTAQRRRAAQDVLERLGIEHRRDFLPNQLSGGEQQRVAIARALVGRPPLLLCDEPTGDLDSQTATEILDLLDRQVDDGVTVIVITHDPQVGARANRVVTMADGRLAP